MDFTSQAIDDHLSTMDRTSLPNPFLTSTQWALVHPLLPPPHVSPLGGRPPLDQRLVLDAILRHFAYRLPWLSVLHSPGSSGVCYHYYRRWRAFGHLDQVYRALMSDLLQRGGFDPRKAVRAGLVTFRKGFRIDVKLPPTLFRSWQLATAMLYFQQVAALLEHNQRHPTHSIPYQDPFSPPPPG